MKGLKITRVCEQCGITHYPKRESDNKRFCSNECAKINRFEKSQLSKEQKCLSCNNTFYSSNKNSKFCSSSCSAIYTNKSKGPRTEQTRLRISLSTRGKSKNRPKTSRKCNISRKIFKEKTRKCLICGISYPVSNKCTATNLCVMSRTKSGTFKLLAKTFDIELFNNDSFDKIVNAISVLKTSYETYGMSTTDINNTFNIPCSIGQTAYFLKSLGIQIRTISEANTLAHALGKFSSECNNQFNTGYHIGWNKKKHYYRSSYELIVMKHFDEIKADYEAESDRIVYWDSQKNKERVAIPDFIVSNKLLYEVKSEWTYDRINMEDKFIAYRQAGYEPYLILEGTLYDELPERKKEKTILDYR